MDSVKHLWNFTYGELYANLLNLQNSSTVDIVFSIFIYWPQKQLNMKLSFIIKLTIINNLFATIFWQFHEPLTKKCQLDDCKRNGINESVNKNVLNKNGSITWMNWCTYYNIIYTHAHKTRVVDLFYFDAPCFIG